jgi:hypothetical protein
MSWSFSASGPKEEVLKNFRSQAASAPYKPGTPEGDDIVAAVARVEALAAALAPSEKIAISAYGSHSTTSAGITSAQFSVNVAVAS